MSEMFSTVDALFHNRRKGLLRSGGADRTVDVLQRYAEALCQGSRRIMVERGLLAGKQLADHRWRETTAPGELNGLDPMAAQTPEDQPG